jgi:hypothetical protein
LQAQKKRKEKKKKKRNVIWKIPTLDLHPDSIAINKWEKVKI